MSRLRGSLHATALATVGEGAELETINEAIYQRGLFIHRFGGIEFALAELIMRAREHPTYNYLGDLPWSFGKRLARFKSLVEHDGPIRDYHAELQTALGTFCTFEDRRHFLVHGIMNIPPDAKDRTTLGFRLYDNRRSEGLTKAVVHFGRLDMTLSQLREFVNSLQPISTEFTRLVARVCREAPLPILSFR